MGQRHDEESAAAYLGGRGTPLSVRTLQRMRQTGEGPIFHKLGRAVRYEESDLDAFLAQCRRRSTSEAA
jgi:hypothetical protein